MADLFSQLYGNQSPQNIYFKKLLDQGLDTTPIQSPWQGGSRMAMALLAGLDLRDQDQQEKASQALRMNLPGLQPAQPAQSGIADALAKPAADTSVPRGIRNNNPLNIEAGDFTKGQPGFTGSDGRFAQFGSMDQGTAAANKLLDTYQNKYGLNTVGGIVNRWAPPGENDSRGYAASVAGRMGVGADQPLTPEQRPALIAAMGQFENGRPIPQQAADPAALPPNSAPAQGQLPTMPQAAPQQGAGVNRSPVQIDPAMAQNIRTMIGSKDPAIQQQGFELYKQFAKPREDARPLNEAEKKTYPGAVALKSNGEPIFPPPSTNVTQNAVVNPILQGVSKQFDESRDKANKSSDSIVVSHELRRQLDSGMYTGTLADWQTSAVKLGHSLGLPVSDEQINKMANSEAFMATAAQNVAAKIKAFGSGTSITDSDRKYTQQMVAGNTKLDETSMRRILDINEKLDRYAIQKHNATADQILESADAKREIGAYAPLLKIKEPPAYTPPAKRDGGGGRNDPLGIR